MTSEAPEFSAKAAAAAVLHFFAVGDIDAARALADSFTPDERRLVVGSARALLISKWRLLTLNVWEQTNAGQPGTVTLFRLASLAVLLDRYRELLYDADRRMAAEMERWLQRAEFDRLLQPPDGEA